MKVKKIAIILLTVKAEEFEFFNSLLGKRLLMNGWDMPELETTHIHSTRENIQLYKKGIKSMNLKEHYNKLYQDSIKKIQSDSYEVDKLIDSNEDKRYGITLLLRPDNLVKGNIQNFLSEIKKTEPNQYIYPDSDIHVTVMSIISCYEGFSLNQIQIDDYVHVIQKSISGLNCFNIDFKGLTASPSCLMVQGFLEDDTLNQIRDNLRTVFKDTKLEQSMDKRYAIQTAHSTIFRFKEKFANKEKFLDRVEEYRDYNFGKFKVDSLELVFNDWYQRKEFVKILHQFKLK